MSIKVLVVIGTRPEVIKMAPIIEALRQDSAFEPRVCSTGQHREMLDQTLALFHIEPDVDLDAMKPGQLLTDTAAAIFSGVGRVVNDFRPNYALVQGDTTTAMVSALASFYGKVKVGHVEAGLRTEDLWHPWPEEANRRLAGIVTDFHFAPTEAARQNLLREGVLSERIFVTGNTIVDALQGLVSRLETHPVLREKCSQAFPSGFDLGKRFILVTGHRRESFDGGLESVFSALATIARRQNIQILYPVHLNPIVRKAAHKVLDGVENVFLADPMDYAAFVYAMAQSYLIITDSGGIQEEAPILGKPLLITRTVTERPEAVLAGTGLLVGTDEDLIVEKAALLLNDEGVYKTMSRIHNAWGDGHTARRIVRELKDASSDEIRSDRPRLHRLTDSNDFRGTWA